MDEGFRSIQDWPDLTILAIHSLLQDGSLAVCLLMSSFVIGWNIIKCDWCFLKHRKDYINIIIQNNTYEIGRNDTTFGFTLQAY